MNPLLTRPLFLELYPIVGANTFASYFGDHNVQGMFETLTPLHEMLDKVSLLPHP